MHQAAFGQEKNMRKNIGGALPRRFHNLLPAAPISDLFAYGGLSHFPAFLGGLTGFTVKGK
jgi:hypothetical protein